MALFLESPRLIHNGITVCPCTWLLRRLCPPFFSSALPLANLVRKLTVTCRFGPSSLHQRQTADPRSALFGEYERKTNSVSPGAGAGRPNPYAGSGGYGYGSPAPGAGASGSGGVNGGFRAATPNRKYVILPPPEAHGKEEKADENRGQYSDAVIDELESQNDEQVEGMSARVKMLKDVRSFSFHHTDCHLQPHPRPPHLTPTTPCTAVHSATNPLPRSLSRLGTRSATALPSPTR